jgi:hypothetical protein
VVVEYEGGGEMVKVVKWRKWWWNMKVVAK